MAYETFKQMEADLAKKPGVTNPAGLTAYIARKTYGPKAVAHAAATGTSLRHVKKLKHHPGKQPKKSARRQAIDQYLAQHGRG